MRSSATDAMMIPPLLTVAEVAAAFRVDRATAYRWASDGTLPTVRVGGTLRVRVDELERLLTAEGKEA